MVNTMAISEQVARQRVQKEIQELFNNIICCDHSLRSKSLISVTYDYEASKSASIIELADKYGIELIGLVEAHDYMRVREYSNRVFKKWGITS